MQNRLKILIDPNYDAAKNMAIDEYLFNKSLKYSEKFLRFYSFKKPVITIGYLQKISVVNSGDMPVIRRLTGGRAVIHKKQLTFSVAMRTDSTVNETCKQMSEIFLGVLSGSGLRVDLIKHGIDIKKRSQYCFDSGAVYEIISGGKKIFGCAQYRKKSAFLMQGVVDCEFNMLLIDRITAEFCRKYKFIPYYPKKINLGIGVLIKKYRSFEWNNRI